MITTHEQHEPTEQELINSWMAEFWHHPVFKISEHEARLKQIEQTKEVFWNIAKQMLENSDVQAEERLWKFAKATLIDIERILKLSSILMWETLS